MPKRSTPAIAAIVPTISCPGINGNLGSVRWESTTWRSVRQTAHVCTGINTCSTPGRGYGQRCQPQRCVRCVEHHAAHCRWKRCLDHAADNTALPVSAAAPEASLPDSVETSTDSRATPAVAAPAAVGGSPTDKAVATLVASDAKFAPARHCRMLLPVRCRGPRAARGRG
jgi:hypothetical protein